MVEKIKANRRTGNEIAVIGMAGRFPGAKNIPEFWENLKNGVESLYFLSDEEIKKSLGTALTDIDGYVKSGGGVLEDMEHFDAQFFGYSPREAEIMNPQTRLFHECAWSALEDAGYNPETFRGSIGLYAGASNSFDWEALLLLSGRDQAYGDFAAFQLYDKDFLSTLVAHSLNFRGPVLTLHTACSTSLVAIHLACQALLDGECDMALAGGVTVYPRRSPGYIYQEGMIFSPDGHCRAFDANSKGTVGGNGLGIVVLKNLEEAEADGDHIYAVVKGTALNNDGSIKATYSAPSREGQTAVIRLAHQVAEVEPESITYIETHGTGTDLGDPIEIEALKQAFRIDKKDFCAIGALKTSMGHLDCAAGVSGFIKTVLAIKHRLIPPTLHYQSPNPNIDFENSPFYVNTRLKEWKNDKYPLRAGVSSFGIGGTNAHVIIEEAPEGTGGLAPLSNRQCQLILLSAHTRSALEKMTENLADHLKKNPNINLVDAAYTLQMGRKALRYRGMTVCATLDETIETLSSPKSIKFQTSPYSIKDENRSVVFMLSGQGSQYVNMGLELYQNEPVFRREVDRCNDILEKKSGYHIKDILYPSPGKETEAKEKIDDVLYSGPVKFTFEYALAKLLINWGIRPYAMIGHSFGEYTVAQLAGVFSLEEALRLVVLRGKLMQKIPGGAMMSVPLPEAELKTLLKLYDKLSLAAVNTQSLCIVSGPSADVDQFEKDLNKKGLECLRLNFPRASHSNMMIPIFQEFAQAVSRTKLNAPGIPYISGLTGNWISVEDATDPRYWARHLVEPVRFSDGIEKILQKQPDSIFLQIGCDRGLPLFVNQQPGIKTENLILNLVGHQKEKVPDLYYIQHKIGLLWINGVKINWHSFFPGEKRYRIPLPPYPFERQSYWIHGNPYAIITNRFAGTGSIRKADISDWFYVPSWIRSPLPIRQSAANPEKMEEKSNWLVFIDEYGVGIRLVDRLNQEGHTVIAVKIGKEYTRETGTLYRINHKNKDHYDALLKDLGKRDLIPNGIAHLWSVHRNEKSATDPDFLAELRDRGLCSLVYLAQAVGNQAIKTPLFIGVVTESMQEVNGNEALSPGSATVLGPIKVIPVEYPNIICRSIDILLPGTGSPQEDRLVSQLALELQSIRPETIVAYRGSHRWTQTFKPFPLEKPDAGSGILKEQGVYLITGGLGGTGLELAEFIAGSVNARLVLTGRSAFPPKEEWKALLETQGDEDTFTAKIRKIRELEELGAEMLILSADVTDQQQMEGVIHQVINCFGQINGVIHAAGDPGGGIIQAQTMETITNVLNPKVIGTVTLNRVLKDIDLDFFILWSSAGSILSTFGQAGYCSANAFLDAFADYNTTTNGRFTTAINWTRWKKIGMAAPVGLMHQEMTGEELSGGITAAEGIEAFSRILGQRVPRIVAIESDFIREWEQFNQLKEAGTPEQLNFQEALAEEKPAAVLFPRPELKTPYRAPRDKLEQILVDIWQKLFGLEQVGIDDDFFELGGDSLRGMRFVNKYNEMLKEIVHVNVIFSAPTIAELAVYFKQHYPDALTRMLDITSQPAQAYPTEKINTATIDRMRQIIPSPPPRPGIETPKNPPAIFLLSPPRSGSTLLRVILTGHPKLFAPPELGLMAFNTVNDPEFVDQGSIRAVMELQDCTREKAQEIMQELRDRQITGKGFYRMMQNWLGDRVLVDKTPNYGLLLEVLKRIEADFENPFYIHLLRHPYGMIRSFDEAKMDLVSGSDLLKKLSLTRLQYAELTWTINHQNILKFLKDIPQQRQYRVVFEELLSQPRLVVEGICQFLGLDFNPEMLQPYGDKEKRMTDGIYNEGMMIGDMKFHTHKRIETGVADTWKNHYHTDFLGDVTWELAETFGYKRIKETIYSSINPIEKKDYYALSSAQKRLYILQHMEGVNNAYNVPITIYLSEQPDRVRLEKTFRRLIKRHESLRTTFEMKDEEPGQRIHQEVDFVLECFEAAENKAEKIKEDFSRPFDLTAGPLLRVGLLKVKSTWQLLIDAHHIITDGTSHTVLTGEFMTLYAGKELLPLRLQYKDYSQWQNNQVVKETFKPQEEYWLKKFEGEIPALNLPIDYSRPPLQSFEGGSIDFEITPEQTEALNQMTRREKSTLFMVLLTVYNVFLSKLSNQEDIVVGTPIANRKHTDLESIIGMFVNTLALRNYPSRDKQFRGFLREVRESTLEAFENQDYPFEDLVEKAVVQRDLSRNPLFDMVFILQNIPAEPNQLPRKKNKGLSIKAYGDEKRTSKFDFTLIAFEQGEKLCFRFEYCSKLFKKETMVGFTKYLKKIISSIIEIPGERIGEIDIITAEEKKRLLVDFNDTETGFPKDKLIHQLFEEQVERTPDHIALMGLIQGTAGKIPGPGRPAVTYRELNQRSNQLAHLLREKHVQSDIIVALRLERSIEMMIGIWAVMKAGGAYLPLDPDYPPERTSYILEDSDTSIIITGSRLKEQIGDKHDSEMIEINHGNLSRASLSKKRPQNLGKIGKSTDLAYVIYTSGSTGKPKGVMIQHRGLANFIKGITGIMDFNERDRILSLTTISFDIFGLETILPLTTGSLVVIGTSEEQLDAEAAALVMAAQDVTILQVTPSRLTMLISNEISASGLKFLKFLLVGGEALPESLLNKTRDLRQGKIYNMFGPTETTIWSTVKEVTIGKALNIGKPIANTGIYILGQEHALQPMGVPGELCISGAGLARGYINNVPLTHKKFTANPHAGGERLYHTGDIARWLPEGNIEFLGREDFQVKIRGFRIELAEIENQLAKHKGIRETVVVCHQDDMGDKYIYAYFIPHEKNAFASDSTYVELREHLLLKLPDYMIPTHFVPLERIPLTPNGKVDRKMLPEPGIEKTNGHIAPRNEIEEKLAEIWADVLGKEKNIIGIDSNFFQLGGHSLKATMLVAKIHKQLNVKLSITEIFKTPRIRDLSQCIKRTGQDKFLSVEPMEDREYYGLSSAQYRLYFINLIDPESTAYNMPIFLVLEGDIDKNRLKETFGKLIARHESLRTSYLMLAGEPVQRIHETFDFSIEYHDAETSEDKVRKITEDFIRPFDLSRAPLLRVGLVREREDRHILMVNRHHISTDAISNTILLQDFISFFTGKELPYLRLQYKDFSQWQNRLFKAGVIEKQEGYWINRFKGDIPVLDLPTDYPRPSVRISDEGAVIIFTIDKELTAGLYDLLLETETTMFMLLLAVYNILLSKYSGQEDIVVGSPVSGRRHSDLENMIGLFINMLSIRNRPEGNKTFREFLEEVKENALAAYENQDFQFEELVSKLHLQGVTDRNPLFNVVFAILNVDEPAIENQGLALKFYGTEKLTSKFDLRLAAAEGGNVITVSLTYSTTLFKKTTAEKMTTRFIEILDQVVKNFDIKLKDLTFSHELLVTKSHTLEQYEEGFEF